MQTSSTAILSTTPEEGVRVLKQAVTERTHWRIRTGRGEDAARFVIEKPVRYSLGRGWPITATYTIVGGFRQTANGQTTLQYFVSGQPWIPFFHSALFISALVVFTLLLGGLVFSPMMVNRWIGVLLLGVIIAVIVGYGWFAYRSYQGHLKELARFMDEFAQRMGLGSGGDGMLLANSPHP
jgi:hypothetical protein